MEEADKTRADLSSLSATFDERTKDAAAAEIDRIVTQSTLSNLT